MQVKAAILLSSIVILQSCTGRGPVTDEELQLTGNEITRAKRFSIERKNDDVSVLRLYNPWQGANNVTMEYFLVKEGAAIPDGVDETNVIRVPVESIVCMSVTHAAMIEALSKENTIRGLSGTDLVYSQALRSRIDNGSISEVGYEASLNNELIAGIKPDLVMMYGIGSEAGGYVSKLREMGLRILFNADYLETSPLARAEWIKMFGALYCMEGTADSIFRAEEKEYEAIREIVLAGDGHTPDVLLGLPFRDTWYVSPGNSYISTLINDAGGRYLWSDVESEISMPYGIEKVYLKAMRASIWLNTGTAGSMGEIATIDSRLTDLPCFKNGMIYNNIKRMTLSGGNDYWENGTVHPHLILMDMATIIHPELFGAGDLNFYIQLPE